MTPDPFVLMLSRVQFGLTIGFHYIFVPLTLGLIVAVATMDSLRFATGNHEWRRAARFWYRFFVLAWFIGMATGYPLRMQLEHQWSGYSVQAREVIHAIMGMEGTIAPAMISLVLVLASLSHGQPAFDRAVTRWLLAAVMFIQAACIVTLNAWMQHPVGTAPGEAGVQIVSLREIFLSSTAVWKVTHTLSAGLLTGAIFIASVSSWYLLKRRHLEVARHSLRLALPMAALSLVAAIWSGHSSAREVMLKQPMKFAAIEAHWEQGAGPAPLTLIAWPDVGAQANRYAIEVPKLMSWLATHSDASPPGVRELVTAAEARIAAALHESGSAAGAGWRQLHARTAQVDAGWHLLNEPQRLRATALASVPSVPALFASFRVMVGCALVLGFVLAAALLRGRALFEAGDRWRLRLLWLCLPLPWIATFAGWTVAEVGRQPWVIYEQMTTAGAATLPPAARGLAEFATFGVAYAVLGLVFWRLTAWLLRMGPRRRAFSPWRRVIRWWRRRGRSHAETTILSAWFERPPRRRRRSTRAPATR